MNHVNKYVSIIAVMALGTQVAVASKPPAVNEDGMELVESSRNTTIYADPGIDLGVYNKIQLETVTVAFTKNWKRNQNRYQSHKVRDSDVERIKADTAELFQEIFVKELTENGYEIATETGDDVLRVVPAIIDLNITAPDTRSATQVTSYSESGGSGTLQLDLYDSVTGDKLVTARDRKSDRRQGWMEWRTRVSNRADAQRAMRDWAVSFREALDEARGVKS